MKKIFLLITAGLFTGSLYSQGIEFEHGTWAEVQQKAKKEGKYIFVDGYTTWCGPCKWMAKNIFPNDTAGQFYNKNFVNYKLDMEKGEGIEFAKKFQVNSYPTYIYLTPKGDLIHRSGGSKPLAMFIKDGENAMNPEAQFVTLEKKFKSGDRDVTFLKNYGNALMNAGQEGDAVAEAYISSAPQGDLYTQESFELLTSLSSPGSKGFNFIVKNKDQFTKTVDKNDVNQYVLGSLIDEASRAGRNKNYAKLTELKQTVKDFNPENLDEVSSEMEVNYYKGAKDLENAFKTLVPFIEKYKMNDASELNSHSWYVFESTSDKSKLEKATGWAKRSVELKPEYANTDTYANLLFRIGNLAEAQKWAEKSIAYAKEEGTTATETEQLLEQIKQKSNK